MAGGRFDGGLSGPALPIGSGEVMLGGRAALVCVCEQTVYVQSNPDWRSPHYS